MKTIYLIRDLHEEPLRFNRKMLNNQVNKKLTRLASVLMKLQSHGSADLFEIVVSVTLDMCSKVVSLIHKVVLASGYR